MEDNGMKEGYDDHSSPIITVQFGKGGRFERDFL